MMIRNKFLYTLLSIALLLPFTACKDETWEKEREKEEASGRLSLSTINLEIVNSKAFDENTIPAVDDFIVEILRNGELYQTFWSYGTMPSEIILPTGTYTVRARSGDVKAAAWWSPYFVGTNSITIREDEVTEVETIMCRLANIRVTINIDPELRSLISDDSYIRVAYQNENDDSKILTYTMDAIDNDHEGYFEHLEGGKTLIASFVGKVDGEDTMWDIPCVNLGAGEHRVITLSLRGNGETPGNTPGGDENPGGEEDNKPGDNLGDDDGNGGDNEDDDNSGTIELSNGLKIDVTITVHNLTYVIDIDDDIFGGNQGGNNQPENPGDDGNGDNTGSKVTVSFESSYLNLDGVNDARLFGPDLRPAVLLIKSETGFKHIFVKIDSPALKGELGPLEDEFDLASATGDVADSLDQLGLVRGDKVLGQKEVEFNVTTFIPLLQGFGVPCMNHFYITAVDENSTMEIDLRFRTYEN